MQSQRFGEYLSVLPQCLSIPAVVIVPNDLHQPVQLLESGDKLGVVSGHLPRTRRPFLGNIDSAGESTAVLARVPGDESAKIGHALSDSVDRTRFEEYQCRTNAVELVDFLPELGSQPVRLPYRRRRILEERGGIEDSGGVRG